MGEVVHGETECEFLGIATGREGAEAEKEPELFPGEA